MSTRIYAFMAAIGALLLSGVVCHSLADDSEQLDAAAARVAEVPMNVGLWHGQVEATEDRSFEQTGAKTYWMRHYVHQKTDDSVLVILMCGRAGRMAVHTPEICYSGAGYELQDQPTASALTRDATFWTAQFTKKTGQLRLYWAWNAQGAWEASASPRWQFRGEAFLYKLYVSHEVSQPLAGTPQADVTADFLRSFVPELNQALFPL